jgi:hypothetical protein
MRYSGNATPGYNLVTQRQRQQRARRNASKDLIRGLGGL